IQKLRWKAHVLEEYPNRDLMVKLRQDSEVEILGKTHRVSGFVVLDHLGEKGYVFGLKMNGLERWLEFRESEIILWGEWSDPDLWGDSVAREQPEPILVRTIEQMKGPPIIDIGGIQARIIDRRPSSRARIIWGRWARDVAYKETVYDYVDAVVLVGQKEATVDGRKLYATLGAYGGQAIFDEILVGNELRPRDVKIAA
ncbi:MAG: hypothetical protein ACE5MG_12805, partial [Candidatus Methylomirabilales bacterium]